tara:strand:+ start:38 stop:490 length:453 start_codon:yes stop_codon:yes gene_type:complete
MQKNILTGLLIFFCFFCQNSLATNEYFLTLRNDKTNLRQGPSFEYPIKIFYKKKHLPILIIDKSENFRKIQDHENNTGWIHISQLSKKKAAIIKAKKVLVFKNPTIYSKPQVILEKGKLCLIIKCKTNWCKIRVDKYSGWVKKENLWGRI